MGENVLLLRRRGTFDLKSVLFPFSFPTLCRMESNGVLFLATKKWDNEQKNVTCFLNRSTPKANNDEQMETVSTNESIRMAEPGLERK